jgi:hypothetical protein
MKIILLTVYKKYFLNFNQDNSYTGLEIEFY